MAAEFAESHHNGAEKQGNLSGKISYSRATSLIRVEVLLYNNFVVGGIEDFHQLHFG